ncbi:unnamed protein product [Cylindrotheca closterium]|uniref:Heterogeneous nuclear ribonucleoprotein Q acidic domain-containing protein n=1 Tax=Cylindrotheca closterium TaxID=2856 RepID=A0AAD2CRV3_9STRA|nr:unnamed protein product [Cylindrotheca closterium]
MSTEDPDPSAATEETPNADENADGSDDDEDLFGEGSDDEEAAEEANGDAKEDAQEEAAEESKEGAPAPAPESNSTFIIDKAPAPVEAPAAASPAPANNPSPAKKMDAPIPRTSSASGGNITSPIPRSTTIPRNTIPKSPPKAASPSPAKSSSGPEAYNLPSGVNMPESVNNKLLQGRLLDTLRSLPTNLINDALTEYDDAVKVKQGSIRNHGAYLYGVIKRYVSVQERTAAGQEAGMGTSLTPAVNLRIAQLIREQFCTEEEMGNKVKMKLRMLTEKDALLAIDELASVERRQIRNFGSYFMGILNRYMRGEANPHANKNKQEKNKRPDQNNYRGKIQDHNDGYRNQRNNFDQARPAPNMRPPQQQQPPYMGNQPYGQQQQSYQQSPPMVGMGGGPPLPPPPPPRPGMNPSYPGQQPNMAYGQQHQQRGPPTSQYGPQSVSGPASSSYGPASQYGNVSLQSHMPGGAPMGGMGGLPPPPPPPPGRIPNQMYGNNNLAPPMQAPSNQSYTNPSQQLQNQYLPPMQQGGGYMQQQAPPMNNYQQPLNQQQHQTPAGIMDILGIADKAASAVQALQQHGVPPQMHQQLQQPLNMYSSAPGQQQPFKQPGGFQAPYGAPGMQQFQKQNPYGPPPNKKSRRTTATMQELPMNVQYVIQNLQMTGQIDGPLDEGILGMVKDLPESLAMTAFQKFGSIDKQTMRNKTAYLAGVLRRELEKINRR